MSLRLQLLQVAGLRPRLLGDSTELVREFFRHQLSAHGAGLDRAGRPDLYYTIFTLAGLQAVDVPVPFDAVEGFSSRMATAPISTSSMFPPSPDAGESSAKSECHDLSRRSSGSYRNLSQAGWRYEVIQMLPMEPLTAPLLRSAPTRISARLRLTF